MPGSSTKSDIIVIIFDNASPANRTVLSSNYSVSLNAVDQSGNISGGTVTYPTVGGISPLAAGVNQLPAGWQMVILRVEPMTQILNLLTNGVWDGPTITAALDAIVFQIQQISEQLSRTLAYPENITPSTVQLNPSGLTPSITAPIVSGTFAQLIATAQLAPTKIFSCFATDLGVAGQYGVYCGSTAVGNQGFIFLGGG